MNETLLAQYVKPVWTESSCINQTAAFRYSWEQSSGAQKPELLIAADTDVTVWINGEEVWRGQYPDYAEVKTVSRVDLSGKLRKGKNTIAVLAYHVGIDGFFTCLNGPGYVIAAILDGDSVLMGSSTDWKCCQETGWCNGRDCRRTVQLGFSMLFDARVLPGWTEADYDDSAWKHAVKSDLPSVQWRERPVPGCRVEPLRFGEIVKCGTFGRKKELDTPALTMIKDQYYYTPEMPESAGTDDGVFAIFDLGLESVGFLYAEVEAPEGAIVDIAHGEHLDDGIVRAYVGIRNFADRFITRAGVTRFELYFHRCGLRYIQINISGLRGGKAKILRAGVRPWSYPLPASSKYASDVLSDRKLREVSIRTLTCCMHDHFEDCPWREQSMYSYDSRNQALYGYYLWGNYDFVQASYQLIADSWSRFGRDLHLMTMCAPTIMGISIPVFSFAWLIAAYEHYLYSGSRALFDNNREMLKDILDDVLSRRNPANGLYHTGSEKARWNFYEWTEGLEGLDYGCPDDEYHSTYNLYLIELLEDYAVLSGESSYKDLADDLRKAVHKAFWNPEKKAYASRLNRDGFLPEYHEHIQFLAFRNNIIPDAATADMVFSTLKDESLNFATLSSLPYMVNALMPLGPEQRDYVAQKIRSVYGTMVEKGATTLWETQRGAADFDNAGSLCHGWSSLPVYYQGAEVLGVRPMEPGFRKFVVRPYADALTHFAEGEVPTPHGMIRISWQKRDTGLCLKVHAPAGTSFVVESYPECPVTSVENF